MCASALDSYMKKEVTLADIKRRRPKAKEVFVPDWEGSAFLEPVSARQLMDIAKAECEDELQALELILLYAVCDDQGMNSAPRMLHSRSG